MRDKIKIPYLGGITIWGYSPASEKACVLGVFSNVYIPSQKHFPLSTLYNLFKVMLKVY